MKSDLVQVFQRGNVRKPSFIQNMDFGGQAGLVLKMFFRNLNKLRPMKNFLQLLITVIFITGSLCNVSAQEVPDTKSDIRRIKELSKTKMAEKKKVQQSTPALHVETGITKTVQASQPVIHQDFNTNMKLNNRTVQGKHNNSAIIDYNRIHERILQSLVRNNASYSSKKQEFLRPTTETAKMPVIMKERQNNSAITKPKPQAGTKNTFPIKPGSLQVQTSGNSNQRALSDNESLPNALHNQIDKNGQPLRNSLVLKKTIQKNLEEKTLQKQSLLKTGNGIFSEKESELKSIDIKMQFRTGALESSKISGMPKQTNKINSNAISSLVISRNKLPGGTSIASINTGDSLALVALYNSTNGPSWYNNTNWLSDPVIFWYGVTANGGRVTKIDLTNNNLSGTIPAEIGNLTNLDTLIFQGNQLTGSIPVEIGSLSDLRMLVLWNNQLSGNIPPELGNLTNLEYMDLDSNPFTGSIPAEIGNLVNLRILWLDDNGLSGNIQ